MTHLFEEEAAPDSLQERPVHMGKTDDLIAAVNMATHQYSSCGAVDLLTRQALQSFRYGNRSPSLDTVMVTTIRLGKQHAQDSIKAGNRSIGVT
jgi:hypothetical protein